MVSIVGAALRRHVLALRRHVSKLLLLNYLVNQQLLRFHLQLSQLVLEELPLNPGELPQLHLNHPH